MAGDEVVGSEICVAGATGHHRCAETSAEKTKLSGGKPRVSRFTTTRSSRVVDLMIDGRCMVYTDGRLGVGLPPSEASQVPTPMAAGTFTLSIIFRKPLSFNRESMLLRSWSCESPSSPGYIREPLPCIKTAQRSHPCEAPVMRCIALYIIRPVPLRCLDPNGVSFQLCPSRPLLRTVFLLCLRPAWLAISQWLWPDVSAHSLSPGQWLHSTHAFPLGAHPTPLR